MKFCIFLPCLAYLSLKCFSTLCDSSGSNKGKQLLGLTFKRLISLLLSDSNFQLFALSWYFVSLSSHFFVSCLLLDLFFIALCTKLGLSYPLILGCHIAFVTILWILLRFIVFHCMHGGERTTLHDIVRNVFTTISYVARVNPCPSTPHLVVFALSNQHCAFSWWCLHVGKCCHHQPHSNWFGFIGCFFLWGCCDNPRQRMVLIAISSQWTCFSLKL